MIYFGGESTFGSFVRFKNFDHFTDRCSHKSKSEQVHHSNILRNSKPTTMARTKQTPKNSTGNNNEDKPEDPPKVENSPVKVVKASTGNKEDMNEVNEIAASPQAKSNQEHNKGEEDSDPEGYPFEVKPQAEIETEAKESKPNDKKSDFNEFFMGDLDEDKKPEEKKMKTREQTYQPIRFLYFKGNEILLKAGISGLIIAYGYNRDPPKQATIDSSAQPAFMHYHIKEMESNEVFMVKTMGVLQLFKLRKPDGKKGYWTENVSGYHRPFYGFAMVPNKGDEKDGRATCDAFIEKLNDCKSPNVQHVISQYTSVPKFKLFSHKVKPMNEGANISKLMAADVIIHTWRKMRMNPDLILAEKGLSTQLGKDILNLFFGTTDEGTVENIRKVNNLIKKKEEAESEFV